MELYLDKENTYTLKGHCIQESIYGVDIDPGAIDIAKLRLWLSLIVDEEDFKIFKHFPISIIKLQGNSLKQFHGISLNIKKRQATEDFFASGSDLDKLIDKLTKNRLNF